MKSPFLNQVRERLQRLNYSIRTEESYLNWIKRYILFHNKRHPAELGKAEMEAFLTDLAVRGRVSASTQNQALSALVFMYKKVLDMEPPWVDGVVRAKQKKYIPVVLSCAEMVRVLSNLKGRYWLIGNLLYGSGDTSEGFGLELGGGLSWQTPAKGLTVDVRGRYLLEHEAAEREEWGLSGSLRYEAWPNSAYGPSFSLRHEYGNAPAASGLDRLLSDSLTGCAGGRRQPTYCCRIEPLDAERRVGLCPDRRCHRHPLCEPVGLRCQA